MTLDPHLALLISPTVLPDHQRARTIICPGLAQLEPAQRELAAILPVADMNGSALAACAAGGLAGTNLALMMADPFLNARRVADALLAAGVSRVVNFPTVQILDGDSARAMDSAGVGAEREAQVLAELCSSGLAATGIARGWRIAERLIKAGVDQVILHPGVALRDWRSRAVAALELEGDMQTLAACGHTAPLIFKPAGFGNELDRAIGWSSGTVQLVG